MLFAVLKFIGFRGAIFLTLAVTVLLYIYAIHQKNMRIEEENKNYKTAFGAYEELLKKAKFETKTKQKKKHTDEKIFTILHNHSTVMDGNYSL